MNYLTQYYKNLSEQLQARVNQLQEQIQLLNEIGDTPAGQETLMRYHGSASQSKRAAGRAQAEKRLGAHGEIEVEDYETAPDEDGGQMFKVKGRTEKGVPVEYQTPRQFGIDVPTPKSGKLSPQELATLAFGGKSSPTKFSIIDRIAGDVRSQSGEGAEYLVRGEDGHHYTVHAPHNAQWAWDNESPAEAPKTWELTKGKQEFSVLNKLDPNDKYDAKLMKYYKIID